jgi:Fic family protein
MKIPVPPTPWPLLAERYADHLGPLLACRLGPEVGGEYVHWDQLRHLTPPLPDLGAEAWWLCVRWARMSLEKQLPLLDKSGAKFTVTLSDSIQRKLFLVARDAAGALKGADRVQSEQMRDRYLVRSLMEEAMTSSQLEGAATTTQAAKEMLSTGRAPRDYGERMIFNNFATMQELKRWQARPLTPDAVFEMHRMLTDGTLEDRACAGRFRRKDENIVVEDETGTVLHVPPPAEELPDRLQRLCDFANQEDDGEDFVHPVVRAIMIHFMIGYDHPFCDGNGRTARALFYWSMMRSGFWMVEYLSISSILKKAPGQYMRSYLHTETDASDATYFLAHQLDVLLKAIAGVHGYIERKQRSEAEAQALLRPGNRLAGVLNHRQRALLLNALRHPGKHFTIEAHRRAHGVSYQTARTDLLGLAAEALLVQYKQGKAFFVVGVADLGEKLRR